jgi:hypothetical protein
MMMLFLALGREADTGHVANAQCHYLRDLYPRGVKAL